VDVGHPKPWIEMSRDEQKAFQHAYSRHASELGLPPWSQRNAESLRQQFNAAAGNIRQNAQRVTMTNKPFGIKGGGAPAVSEPVRFFEYTDPGGVVYYYFETLEGRFISAGLSR